MKSALRVLAFVCAAVSPATAQAPFPGAVLVNDGWVPCDHPIAIAAGRSCAAPTPGRHTGPGLIDCTRVNGYTHPADALQCALDALPTPPAPLPTFQVGRRYVGAYPSQQMLVLGLTRSIDGVEVVTFQWIRETADVGACRNDGGPATTSCNLWRPHESP